MKVPKLKVDLFPNDTSPSKSFEVSFLKIGWWIFVFVFVAGSLGWMILHPDIFDDFLDKKPGKIRAQNQEFVTHLNNVKSTVESVRNEIDSLKMTQTKISGLLGEGQNLLDSLVYHFPNWDTLNAAEIRTIVDSIYLESEPIFDSLFQNTLKTTRLPLGHPMGFMIKASATYGMRLDPFTGRKLPHLGVDFPCFIGDTIYAPGAGAISAVGRDRGFGLIMKINHTNGIESTYAHLSAALKNKGHRVNRMTPIALCGKSGRSTGPHLHYEISVDDTNLDPLRILELYEADMRVVLKTEKEDHHHE